VDPQEYADPPRRWLRPASTNAPDAPLTGASGAVASPERVSAGVLGVFLMREVDPAALSVALPMSPEAAPVRLEADDHVPSVEDLMAFTCAPDLIEDAVRAARATPTVASADSSMAGVVRSACHALADRNIEALLDLVDGDVVWVAAAGGPYGGTYCGSDRVAALVTRMAAEWAQWGAEVDLSAAIGRRVVVAGSYRGVAAKTGRKLQARFVQVWTVFDGRIVAHEEIVDTTRLAAPLIPHRPSIP
jgi:ketosteroid isomerase-like protein